MRKFTTKSIFIATIILIGSVSKLHSQGIRGKILDMNGDPVPYAAIFIKELSRGTTCNALGMFSLPLPAGEYNIFFRSLGYTEVSKSVKVAGDFSEINIELPPQTYMIPEVRVSATGEDPAYWIMRKTIGLANYHLHEVSSYHAEIYIKGTAYIEKMPRAIARRIEVNEIKVKEDEAYMLESLNEVKFTAPDRYDMRVLASQNTLPGYTQNVNPMDYINASLYQQEIENIVSPLARNAFTYYRYSFEGTFMEGTHIINKIRVIPKRKSQQLCEGYLYIVEDLWCLHSSDILVNTIAGTVHLQQLYANVIMDAWLPVNHKIQANVEIAGVKGQVTYVSSLEYSHVTLNPNLPETYFTPTMKKQPGKDMTGEEGISREQKKINELLKKEELSNRDVTRLSKLIENEAKKAEPGNSGDGLNQTGTVFSLAKNAVNNDSAFWNRIRPIPLTPEEHISLMERDSIIGPATLKTGGESPRTTSRKGNPFRDFMLGRTINRDMGRFRLTYGGLLDMEMLGYNSVDGIYYGQDLRLNWKPDTSHTIRSRLVAGYAFHRGAPRITWNSDLLYAPMARGKVALYLNYTSADFNGFSGIPAATNLVYTLFLRENYLKMYEQADATLYNRIDVVNGLVLNSSVTLGRQKKISRNHNEFSLFFRNSKDFTGNLPPFLGEDNQALMHHNHMTANVLIEFTPRHYYVLENRRKAMRESRWPTFSVNYYQAIPLDETGWSKFTRLDLGITQDLEVGLLADFHWSVEAGTFLNNESLHYSDYKHFKSSPLLIDMAGFDHSLMFMNYYEAATDRSWAFADAKLTTSYLALKFIPWFSERLWKESVGFTYLYTPHIQNYIQAGYSLNELFFLADVGIYAAFQEWEYRGFSIRLNFRF